MFHQSGGRGQRPKGFRVKQALQFGLLLAVCVWLFYKLQHSDEKGSSYGDNTERRISKVPHQIIDFGRKGMSGSNAGNGKMFRDENGVEVYEDLLESIVKGEGENEEETETQEVDSQTGGDTTSIKDVNVEFGDTNEGNAEENVMNHEEEVDEKELNKDGNEAMGAEIGEKGYEMELNRREEGSEGNEMDAIESQQKENDERIDSNSEEDSINTVDKMQLQPSQREKPNAADTSKIEEGVESFQDVNGIPPDGLQLVKSSPNVDKADEPNASSDQETISSSDNEETSHGDNRTEYDDILLDGGVDDEVQFSKKGTDSENNEGSSDSLQELTSQSKPTEQEYEPSNTNSAEA